MGGRVRRLGRESHFGRDLYASREFTGRRVLLLYTPILFLLNNNVLELLLLSRI